MSWEILAIGNHKSDQRESKDMLSHSHCCTYNVNGQLLMAALISNINVLSSSKSSNECPTDFFKQFLTLLTSRSQTPPPHQRAFSTINCQVTFLVVVYCLTAVDLMTFEISFEASLNPFALPEMILVGNPRDPTKCLNVHRNELAGKSIVNSK